jgi:hypothetical protein
MTNSYKLLVRNILKEQITFETKWVDGKDFQVQIFGHFGAVE